MPGASLASLKFDALGAHVSAWEEGGDGQVGKDSVVLGFHVAHESMFLYLGILGNKFTDITETFWPLH